MIPDYTPPGTYSSIRSAAVFRIEQYEREGAETPFDPKQLGVHARVLKKLFDTHTTADQSTESACIECGRPWPCDTIRLIFVPPSALD
ncbi:hypothetical protein [Nocardia sp. NPDC058705]|uniref:hypothetical protein n=1 Tax=Nocardia sp. NPDC058705 TaxID=3346609 RepID=UPI0036C42F59